MANADKYKTLELIPRGNVSKSYNFGTNKVEYESGSSQYQRKWITPRLTLSFEAEGDAKMKEYLEQFILDRCGDYEPFKWKYNGETAYYRFASSTVDFDEIRGYGGVGTVGYTAKISLLKCKDSEI